MVKESEEPKSNPKNKKNGKIRRRRNPYIRIEEKCFPNTYIGKNTG